MGNIDKDILSADFIKKRFLISFIGYTKRASSLQLKAYKLVTPTTKKGSKQSNAT